MLKRYVLSIGRACRDVVCRCVGDDPENVLRDRPHFYLDKSHVCENLHRRLDARLDVSCLTSLAVPRGKVRFALFWGSSGGSQAKEGWHHALYSWDRRGFMFEARKLTKTWVKRVLAELAAGVLTWKHGLSSMFP